MLADVLLCIPHKKGDISVIPNKKQLGKNGIHFFSNKETETYGFTKKECSNTPIHPLMTSSDFLVLITILLAIVSTAIANNKMIWIYKFSRFSIITYILIMIAINYFIFFRGMSKEEYTLNAS